MNHLHDTIRYFLNQHFKEMEKRAPTYKEHRQKTRPNFPPGGYAHGYWEMDDLEGINIEDIDYEEVKTLELPPHENKIE